MMWEEQSVQLNRDLQGNEHFISEYRNMAFTLHDTEEQVIDKDAFRAEFHAVYRMLTIQDFELAPLIQDKILIYADYIGDLKELHEDRALFTERHNHSECVMMLKLVDNNLKQVREEGKRQNVNLQKKIDTCNMLIMALLALVSFLLLYTMIYASFGETK